MSFSLRVTDSNAKIENAILEALAEAFNEGAVNAIDPIKVKIQEMSRILVKNTPEFQSLYNNGDLNAELGLRNPRAALDQILDELANGVTVVYNPIRVVGRRMLGGLTITILTDDFSRFLNLSGATYTSNHKKIPWLQWLLLLGNSYIIMDYEIMPGSYSKRQSRSGKAIMVETKNKRGGWRIPPQYSGTSDNNFLTRAFTDEPRTEQAISDIIEYELIKAL